MQSLMRVKWPTVARSESNCSVIRGAAYNSTVLIAARWKAFPCHPCLLPGTAVIYGCCEATLPSLCGMPLSTVFTRASCKFVSERKDGVRVCGAFVVRHDLS